MSQPYAMVIEDDPKLSSIYVTTLQQVGFDVALDMNGDQCQMLLSAAEPAFVILDLHLPFASGAELLPIIRARCPKAIIVVVTADLLLAKSISGKADHVLIKPVSVAHLLRIAKSAIEVV